MKSQDILILLKLICLEGINKKEEQRRGLDSALEANHERYLSESGQSFKDMSHFDEITSSKDLSELSDFIEEQNKSWKGWETDSLPFGVETALQDSYIDLRKGYSVRELADLTGVSKTAVASSIQRSISSGLLFLDRRGKHPRVHRKVLLNFIIHGIKYVFPAQLSTMQRGIPTSFASPALSSFVASAGDLIYVWPDPRGKNLGQAVTPFFQSVPFAVRKDRHLYELLALIDAIRLGNPREVKLAVNQLTERITGS